MIDHILKASFERNIIINIIYENEGGVTQRDIKVLEMNPMLTRNLKLGT